MAFIFYQLLLPPGPLAPSSHKTKCNPHKVILMAGLGEWDRCAGDKMKNDRMVGADDGSANPLWWLTKTHE
jgi:hypothetical protein